MTDKRRVLVLGGKGFIGRHAVRSLDAQGCDVTIGTRNPDSAESSGFAEERHVLHLATQKQDWIEIVRRYDVVLNCVGILRQRIGESYDAVHHLAPKALAEACREQGTRLVHVSALGLSEFPKSRFLRSKFLGEQSIMTAGEDWILARLSLLDGEGGYGAAWLRAVSRLPLFVVPTSAKGRIAAMTAEDAGDALARLCLESAATLALDKSRVFELGGESSLDFESYIRGLRCRYAGNRAWCVPVPGLLARLGAHICDVFHFSPFSFGHWELLCHDNVPKPNRLGELLGRAPSRVV